MAPSKTVQPDTMPSQNEAAEEKLLNGEQKVAPMADQTPATNGTAKATNGSGQDAKTADGPKVKEMSGKEKKELAKAQKIAKRAAEKQKQQGQPAIDLVAGNKGDISKDSAKKGPLGPATPASKTQHKRTGSTSAGAQSSLPHRQAPSHIAPVPVEPEKENKNVALLDHLYGHPRRNTVVGAGKDVHPAVLALGLQMRNYIICGSSARCVAMLLAFKRVGAINQIGTCIANTYAGH